VLVFNSITPFVKEHTSIVLSYRFKFHISMKHSHRVLSPFRGWRLHDPETMLAGVVMLPSQTGWRIEVRQSRRTVTSLSLLSYASAPEFLLKVLLSSVYNLFALVGRKAPHSLTHSMKHCSVYFIFPVWKIGQDVFC